MDQRLELLCSWLYSDAGCKFDNIEPASTDASFRRYFRIYTPGTTLIVMDAPPDKEDCRPYVAIAAAFHDLGLNVPRVLAADLERGFLLLSDLGQQQYLSVLDDKNADQLYRDAMASLILLQNASPEKLSLPAYSERLLLDEMGLLKEWFLGKQLGLSLDRKNMRIIEQAFSCLVSSALEQPQVGVHRDYHSRNLMLLDENNPGILDFQDAVIGPLTYDLVSLLKDCYIKWPAEQVRTWLQQYLSEASRQGIVRDVAEPRFVRWFDLMGVQRHLKAIGIFSRLNIRDGKPGYLRDIPRTLSYILDLGEAYPELAGFNQFLRGEVLPLVAQRRE